MIYLSLGSNISPKIYYLNQGIQHLQNLFPDNFKISNFYITKPFQGNYPLTNNENFVNCCIQFHTLTSPQKLLSITQKIESLCGRQHDQPRWSPRTLDIDILIFHEIVYQTSKIQIPHYDLKNRDFFLIPLLELNKSLIDPQSNTLLSENLKNLDDQKKTNPIKIRR